jgi:probable HAF family extracellular repeat protein
LPEPKECAGEGVYAGFRHRGPGIVTSDPGILRRWPAAPIGQFSGARPATSAETGVDARFRRGTTRANPRAQGRMLPREVSAETGTDMSPKPTASPAAHVLITVLTLLMLVPVGATQAHAQGYLTVLEPTGPAAGLQSGARNTRFNQFVGWAITPHGYQHAYWWTECVYIDVLPSVCPDIWVDLGTLGGSYSIARAFTPGVLTGTTTGARIVGQSQRPNGQSHAFLWRDGVMQPLSGLGGTQSDATAISRGGRWIAGTARDTSNRAWPMIWSGETGTMRSMFNPVDGAIEPWDVEEFAEDFHAVGRRWITGSERAFLWTSYGMQDLGTLGGAHAHATAISAHREIVGGSRTTSGAWRAFLWRTNDVGFDPNHGYTGWMQDLGTLGGNYSFAYGIHDTLGFVVGESLEADNTKSAFLWTPSRRMLNLNDLIPPDSGWHLGTATVINGRYIFGWGKHNGVVKEFVLRDDVAPSWRTNAQISQTDVTTTSVSLMWSAADDNIDVAYRLSVNGAPYGSYTNARTATVTGLMPGQTYTFRVEAYDGFFQSTGPATSATTIPTVQPGGNRPNLVVDTISVKQMLTLNGWVYWVSDQTANRGTQPATTSTTRYYLVGFDGVRVLAGTRLAPGPLAPGGVSLSGATGLTGTGRGYFRIMACADGTQTNAETDEADNCRMTDNYYPQRVR